MKLFICLVSLIVICQVANAQFFVNDTSDASVGVGNFGTFRFALNSITGANPSIFFVSSFTLTPATVYNVNAGYTGVLTIQGSGSTINQTFAALDFTSSDVSITGLTIDFSPAGFDSITLGGSGTSTLTSVLIQSSSGNGVAIVGFGDYNFNSVTIEGSLLDGINSQGGATTININNSTIGVQGDPNGDDGVDINDGAQLNVQFSSFLQNVNNGIHFNVFPPTPPSISTSVFGIDITLGNGQAGVLFNADTGAPNLGDFNGNTFIGNGLSVTSNGGGIVFGSPSDSSTFIGNTFIGNNIAGILFTDTVSGIGGGTVDFSANIFTNNGGLNAVASAVAFNGVVNNFIIEAGSVTSNTNVPAYLVLNSTTSLTFQQDINGVSQTVFGGQSVVSAPNVLSHTSLTISGFIIGNILGSAFQINGPTTGFVFSRVGMGLDLSFNDAPVASGLDLFGAATTLSIDQITITNTPFPINIAAGVTTGSITAIAASGGASAAVTTSVISVSGGLTSVTVSGNNIDTNPNATALRVDTLTSSTITQNIFNGGTQGIAITTDITGSQITNNTINGNSVAGIALVIATQINNNVISSNTITANGKGIRVIVGGLRITANSISGNTLTPEAGIDVGAVGTSFTPGQAFGNDQNAPNITFAGSLGGFLTVTGTLNSIVSNTFAIDVYCSPTSPAQGTTFQGTSVITTGATNPSAFSFSIPAPCGTGNFVTATATSTSAGNPTFTSEFSGSVLVIAGSFSVTPTLSVSNSAAVATSISPTISLSNNASASTAASSGAVATSISPTISLSNNASASTAASSGAVATSVSPSISLSPSAPASSGAVPTSITPTTSLIPTSVTPSNSFNPTATPTTTPGITCRDGTVDPGEDCDYGAQTAAFYRARCCNRNSCQFRNVATKCGNRPGPPATPRCVSVPRCSIAGICEPSRPKTGKRCAPGKVCNKAGRCVRPKKL